MLLTLNERNGREVMLGSDASISLFQFRYLIDTMFTKYRDIDIDITVSM